MGARISARSTVITGIITGSLGIVAAVVAALVALSGSSPPSSAVAASTPVQQAAATCQSAPARQENGEPGQLLGQGTIVMLGNGTAYDLDAVNTGWCPLAGHSWIVQNAAYSLTGFSGKPGIQIAGSPSTDVTLSKGPWNYAACKNAPYGADSSTTGPNAVTGHYFYQNERICIETQNTPLKADGNHIVLLWIQAIDAREVTAWVTVWY